VHPLRAAEEGRAMDTDRSLAQVGAGLGIAPEKLKKCKELCFNEEFSIPYFRFKHDVEHVEKGTVVFLGQKPEFMRGFPKIRRLMTLSAGLGRHFKDRVIAEEKMNGYNVRIAMVAGSLVAVTRGGLVCPYTTENIRHRLASNAFFPDNPGLMLCGEVVGLMNPYQTKSYPEEKEFGFFVFDIRDRLSGKPLPLADKEAMLRKYGLQGVKNLGTFPVNDSKKLLALVRRLGDDGREGVVLKDASMSQQAKYTANQSTNSDLEYAFTFFSDYGQPFFYRRLVREAFQAYEAGLNDEQLEKEAAALGRSILLPMVRTIRAIASGKEVTEDFELRVPSMDFGDAFLEHMEHLGVRVSVQKITEDADGIVLRVKRHYPSTNDKTRAYLAGEFCQE
jgi:putative ATP-dependent DNA ligase